jgi:hypothetical protein
LSFCRKGGKGAVSIMHLNNFFAGTLSHEKSRREFSILIDSSREDNELFNDFFSGLAKRY